MTAKWDEPTPSGHVYHTPTTYAELGQRAIDRIQGFYESWDEDERCPDPTWEMVGVAMREVGRHREIVSEVHAEFAKAGMQTTDIDRGMDRYYSGGIAALSAVVDRFRCKE